MGPDPRRKRTPEVVSFQFAFLLKWTKKKMNGKVEKRRCSYGKKKPNNRIHVLEPIPGQLGYYPSKLRRIRSSTHGYGFSCHV